MIILSSDKVRDLADVSRAVEDKLGAAQSLTPLATYARLEGVERIHWVLGELMYGVIEQRFHIWIQRQAQADLDGPRLVAQLAPLVAEIDPLIGELTAWTAERGRAVRAEERGEALISFVPLVWEPVAERARKAFIQLVERWPTGGGELEAPAPYSRATVEPADGGVRYPGCSVAYTSPAGDSDCDWDCDGDCDWDATESGLLVETTLLALWEHGAADDELETFSGQASESEGDLPATLASWVLFDGDGGDEARFAAMRRAQDPVAEILGIESSLRQAIVRIAADRFADIGEALQPYGAQVIRPDDGADFTARTRSALRMGDAFLVVNAADMSDAAEAQLLWQSVMTGITVVLAGTSETAEVFVGLVEAQPPY